MSKPKAKAAATITRSTSQKAMISSVVKRKSESTPAQDPPPQKRLLVQPTSALKTFAVLPGIGDYKSSDDSDASSDEELELVRTDLTGRQLKKKCQEE